MTINQYSIHCTPEQTMKALELGAPLKIIDNEYDERIYQFICGNTQNGKALYIIPTAEEMIGWLEEQNDIEEITIQRNRAFHSWAYLVTNKRNKLISSSNRYQSRKEATISAIDAALEYLVDNKFLK